MRIAVVGSGISGLTAAWLLDQHPEIREITVYEKNDTFGGHTDTHEVNIDGQSLAVDTGFIVFNEHNYPHFCNMLAKLGVSTQASDMSLSVQNGLEGIDYNPSKGYSLLHEPRHFLRKDFRHMLADLLRFYRQTKQLDIDSTPVDLSLSSYLQQHNYSQAFIEGHIYPLCGALWSVENHSVGNIPLRFALGFFQNHCMLQLLKRPQWRTVSGGSASYIKAIQQQTSKVSWRNEAVIKVSSVMSDALPERRLERVETLRGSMDYDAVVFACRAPQALEVIDSPAEIAQQVLSQFEVSDNQMILHTDSTVLSNNPKLWASWNVSVHDDPRDKNEPALRLFGIHYWMNCLQNLPVKRPIITSLNPQSEIDPNKILLTRSYQHPRYDAKALVAQQQWSELHQSGLHRTGLDKNERKHYFTGAYWGWGFHEDGAVSSHRAVKKLLDDHNLSPLGFSINGVKGAIC